MKQQHPFTLQCNFNVIVCPPYCTSLNASLETILINISHLWTKLHHPRQKNLVKLDPILQRILRITKTGMKKHPFLQLSSWNLKLMRLKWELTKVSIRARIYSKNSRYRASGVRYLKLANILDDESSSLCPSFVLLLLDFSILLMFFVECGLLRVHFDLIWILGIIRPP